jgi:hypothetical protein
VLLEEQLRLLHAGIERSFADPGDRIRAATGDYQGVGSPRIHEPPLAAKSGTVPGNGSTRPT